MVVVPGCSLKVSGPSVPILLIASATSLAANRLTAIMVTTNGARLIIYPSSFFSTRPLVRRWVPHVGGEKRIPATQSLPPLISLGDIDPSLDCQEELWRALWGEGSAKWANWYAHIASESNGHYAHKGNYRAEMPGGMPRKRESEEAVL